MKKKTLIIAGGVAVVGAIAIYLYKRNQGPTQEEIDAALREQARQDNIARLLNTSTEQMKQVQEGGKSALQIPEEVQQMTAGRTDLREVLKFGNAVPTSVGGMGNAFALT